MRVAILITAAAVACGGSQSTPARGGATKDLSSGSGARAPAAALADGTYWCTMSVEDFTYDPKPCVVSGGRLTKDVGTMRFRGDLEPAGDGFILTGEFCDGDCDEPFRTEFAKVGGRWIGEIALEGRTWNVAVQPPGSYGGASYGGASYGGAGYGG